MKLGKRALEPKKGQGPKAYTGIDSFYDRQYEYDAAGRLTGVRLRKFFNLGPGRLVTAAQLRALWKTEFAAEQVDPERMAPSSSQGSTSTKLKRSYEHNLQHFHRKRYEKQQREARQAAEAMALLEEESKYQARTLTTFNCKFAADGCPQRPFMTQRGADAHSARCEFSGNGKRPADECFVKARVKQGGPQVALRVCPSRNGIRCSLQALPLICLTLKVKRALKPSSKPYGLQPHRSLVHHRTAKAVGQAARTVIAKRISLTLKVSADRQGHSRVGATLDLKAFKRPSSLSRGWAIRPPQERRRFSTEQRNFLVELYDWPHGRLNEHQACTEFKNKFDASDGPFARSLRLSRAQIKAFFSTEKGRRLKAGAATIVEATPAEDGTAPTPADPAPATPAAVCAALTPAPAASRTAPAPTPPAAACAAPAPAPAAARTAPVPAAARTAPAPAADLTADGLEPDDILDVRWRNGQRQFLVSWVQYDEEDAT